MMLREQTDNERVDYKNKADGHAINNHRKACDISVRTRSRTTKHLPKFYRLEISESVSYQELNYSHLEWKYSENNNNRMQKRKELPNEIIEDEIEDVEVDEDEEGGADTQKIHTNNEKKEGKTEQEAAPIGKCAICHIIINDINFSESIADSKQNPCESYLLCQRCVRKFSVQEHFQSRRSHTSFSQNRDDSDSSRKTHDRPIVMYLQSPSSHSALKLRNRWACNKTMHEVTDDDEESDTISYAVVDHNRANPQQTKGQQTRSYERQGQQQYDYQTTTRRTNNATTERYASETKITSSTTPASSSAECSRRPIRCPRLDCSINVAFSSLTHHFLFDHPEVPILSVEPGAESTLIVSYGALSCNSSRCLALLLVSGKLSDSTARLFGGSQINPKYRNRLPLPVLAARLHGNNYTCCEEVHAGREGQCKKDVIIAWVAGLDVGDTVDRLRCSIQAVDSIDNRGFRSLTYTGPVTSLRAAQRPRDVFLAGDCIVLHEGLISHITYGCTSLNVNVIVH